jgi:hypothetical protein
MGNAMGWWFQRVSEFLACEECGERCDPEKMVRGPMLVFFCSQACKDAFERDMLAW